MCYLYILYSSSAGKYYVGVSQDPFVRLHFHNNQDKTTFTSKYRPWELVALFKVPSLSLARKIENFIKKQKSRRLIEYLIDPKNIPEGKLAQLVRVPHVRD